MVKDICCFLQLKEERRGANSSFTFDLVHLIEVTNPLDHSIVCLEYPHSTAADVLLFFSSALSLYCDIFDDKFKCKYIPVNLIAEILTWHFQELIDSKNGHDVYYAALVLHPGTKHRID